MQPGSEVDHSSPSNDEVKKSGDHPICLQGMDRENFNFTSIDLFFYLQPNIIKFIQLQNNFSPFNLFL
jgi:hypothetical protein